MQFRAACGAEETQQGGQVSLMKGAYHVSLWRPRCLLMQGVVAYCQGPRGTLGPQFGNANFIDLTLTDSPQWINIPHGLVLKSRTYVDFRYDHP